MDLLSPARACDPWATMTARRASQLAGENETLTESQQRILGARQAGPKSLGQLCGLLGRAAGEVERGIDALQHMQKVGGKREGEEIMFLLWTLEDK